MQGTYLEYKRLESEYKLEAKELVEKVTPFRNARCKVQFTRSVNVPTDTGSVVQVTWQNKYSKIPVNAAGELRTVYPDTYEQEFTREIDVNLKRTDEQAFSILEEKLGIDLFAELFGVNMYLKPTEKFHREFPTYDEEKRRKLATIVKQAEPSVKP